MKLLNNIHYFFRRKRDQFRNLRRWLPLVWNKYDFDYSYSIDMFKRALLDQAEFLESDRAVGVSAKDDAKRIRTVVRLMEKVYDDSYSLEYQDMISAKDFVSVQPMNLPSGLVFFLDFKYGTDQPGTPAYQNSSVYGNKLKELYGDDVLDFGFEPSEFKNMNQLVWNYKKKPNAEEIDKMHSELLKESQAKQKRAEQLLWKLVSHNIRGWWD